MVFEFQERSYWYVDNTLCWHTYQHASSNNILKNIFQIINLLVLWSDIFLLDYWWHEDTPLTIRLYHLHDQSEPHTALNSRIIYLQTQSLQISCMASICVKIAPHRALKWALWIVEIIDQPKLTNMLNGAERDWLYPASLIFALAVKAVRLLFVRFERS